MIDTLKGLFWNYRGIRKKGMSPYVRDMIKLQNLDFLCFQETMVQNFFMHVLENWTLIRIICGIGVLLKGNHVVSYLALKWIYLMWVVDHKVILYCSIICEIRK
jgi:hypothetical protein